MVEQEEVKETPKEEPKKMSILDETKEAIGQLKQEREEIAKVRDELQQLRSDQLLSGTAGLRPAVQELTEEEKRLKDSVNFWKGTGIDKAIERYG